MTAHALAKLLLLGPDLIVVIHDCMKDQGNHEVTGVSISKLEAQVRGHTIEGEFIEFDC